MSTDKKTSDHNYYLAHREDIKIQVDKFRETKVQPWVSVGE
jgi:hypothetical protein